MELFCSAVYRIEFEYEKWQNRKTPHSPTSQNAIEKNIQEKEI